MSESKRKMNNRKNSRYALHLLFLWWYQQGYYDGHFRLVLFPKWICP